MLLKLLAALLTAAILLPFAACGGGGDAGSTDSKTSPSQPNITGTLTLSDSDFLFLKNGDPCSGSGGYSDIHGGAQVVVKDESDELIATGSLSAGHVSSGQCDFPIAVRNVPDANFYTIQVSHRGGISYSREELKAKGWMVGLSLGD